MPLFRRSKHSHPPSIYSGRNSPSSNAAYHQEEREDDGQASDDFYSEGFFDLIDHLEEPVAALMTTLSDRNFAKPRSDDLLEDRYGLVKSKMEYALSVLESDRGWGITDLWSGTRSRAIGKLDTKLTKSLDKLLSTRKPRRLSEEKAAWEVESVLGRLEYALDGKQSYGRRRTSTRSGRSSRGSSVPYLSVEWVDDVADRLGDVNQRLAETRQAVEAGDWGDTERSSAYQRDTRASRRGSGGSQRSGYGSEPHSRYDNREQSIPRQYHPAPPSITPSTNFPQPPPSTHSAPAYQYDAAPSSVSYGPQPSPTHPSHTPYAPQPYSQYPPPPPPQLFDPYTGQYVHTGPGWGDSIRQSLSEMGNKLMYGATVAGGTAIMGAGLYGTGKLARWYLS